MRKAEYTRSVDNELLVTALWIERSANDKSGLTKRTNGYRWDYCSADEYFRTWIVILFLDGKKRYLARLLGRVISGFEWPDLLRCLPPSLMGSKEEMPKRIFLFAGIFLFQRRRSFDQWNEMAWIFIAWNSFFISFRLFLFWFWLKNMVGVCRFQTGDKG